MGLFLNEDEDMEPEEAFEMTRSMILREMDAVLLGLRHDLFDDENEQLFNDRNPMNDPKLNNALQKAFDDYNKRTGK